MCAIAGVYLKSSKAAWPGLAAGAVHALLLGQMNRGDLSTGIASRGLAEEARLCWQCGLGTPLERFGAPGASRLAAALEPLSGLAAIGHNRYATSGQDSDAARLEQLAQPLGQRHAQTWREFAFAFNGHLTNEEQLRSELGAEAAGLALETDTEILRELLSRLLAEHSAPLRDGDYRGLFSRLVSRLDGAYSLVFLDATGTLAALRDPRGVRPLAWGEMPELWACASESEALARLGLRRIESLEPGELLLVDRGGARRLPCAEPGRPAPCSFESIYFLRPDSVFDGALARRVRERLGRELALREARLEPDAVVAPVPRTAEPAWRGYVQGLQERGFRFQAAEVFGVGGRERTFLRDRGEPGRAESLRRKFDVAPGAWEGRHIVLIEDSLVRGHTLRFLVGLLRDRARAKSVQVRVAAPPLRFPCFYGVNLPTRAELLAADREIDEIRKELDLDGLAYLDVACLEKVLSEEGQLAACLGCFTGHYPTEGGNLKLEKMLVDHGGL